MKASVVDVQSSVESVIIVYRSAHTCRWSICGTVETVVVDDMRGVDVEEII